MEKKTIKVKFDKDGTATCIGEHCFGYVTYYWFKGRELKKPIVRCCYDECELDHKSTKDINKDFAKRYPAKYVNTPKKPIKS